MKNLTEEEIQAIVTCVQDVLSGHRGLDRDTQVLLVVAFTKKLLGACDPWDITSDQLGNQLRQRIWEMHAAGHVIIPDLLLASGLDLNPKGLGMSKEVPTRDPPSK